MSQANVSGAAALVSAHFDAFSDPRGCQNWVIAADLVVRRTPRPAAEYAEDGSAA